MGVYDVPVSCSPTPRQVVLTKISCWAVRFVFKMSPMLTFQRLFLGRGAFAFRLMGATPFCEDLVDSWEELPFVLYTKTACV